MTALIDSGYNFGMSTTREELQSFTEFANDRLAGGATQTLEELFQLWRNQTHHEKDRDAVAASLGDLSSRETGRPFDEFAAEFRRRNKLTDP